MIQSNITTVKGTYIICKRVRKEPFYYRGQNYSKTSTTARHAQRFNDKAEADKICKEINDKRKGGHKFRVESSEKHFVSNFMFHYESWGNKLVVKNELIAIQRATKGHHKPNHSLNDKKDHVIKMLTQQLANAQQNKINQLAAHLQLIKSIEEGIQKFNDMISHVQTVDLDKDFVEPNLTQTDKTVNVLYGSKNVNT